MFVPRSAPIAGMTASASEIWMNVLTHAGPARNPAKKWRRCETAGLSEGQTRGLILPGVLDESGRCIALGACLQIGQLVASQLSAQEACIFGQLRELVVGGSLKFFERGFLRRSVKLFRRQCLNHQLTP